jgi:hypothetical protein
VIGGDTPAVHRVRRREEAMPDYTPHQQKIIKRYYDNQDTLARQRLAELVGELYLAKGKKRQRTWDMIAAALGKLNFSQARIDHLRAQDNPAMLAEIVQSLEGQK